MSSRQNLQQIVSTTAPTNIVTVGDEWYNPTTNRLYKSLLYNGQVQWTEIPLLGTTSTLTVSGTTVFGSPDYDPMLYDPYFNKVDVLLHLDGDLQNSALSGITATQVSSFRQITYGTGTFVTTNGVGGAIQFNGELGSGNYHVVIGSYTQNDYQLSGDYTIELWFLFAASEGGFGNYRTLLSKENNSSYGWMLWIYNQQQVNWNSGQNSTAFNWQQGLYFVKDVWYHLAVSRQNNIVRFYINGILQTSLTDIGPISIPLRLGGYPDTFNYRWYGRIDDLRITRDVARYITTNFTPPSAPFPDQQFPKSLKVTYPTVSYSSSTGALVVEGGIASRGNLNIAGDIRSWGQVRADYFTTNPNTTFQSGAYNNPRLRPNYQLIPPSWFSDVFAIAVNNTGLGYDTSNNYVFLSNTNGNVHNSLIVSRSTSQPAFGFYTNNSGGYVNFALNQSLNIRLVNSLDIGSDGTAGIFSVRRGFSNTGLYVYNTDGGQTVGFTPSTYERAVMDWITTPSQLTLGVQVSSGGGRNIRIVTGSNTATVTIVPTAQSTSTTTGALIVSGGLGVGGNIYSGGNVISSGNIVGITKSFLIDHPTRTGKKLQYASLEGPENGVYVRGRLTNASVITLPDYWTGLVDENSITATLTPIGSMQNLWIESVSKTSVTVGSESILIDCYYTVYGERKDIGKLKVEIDK